MYRIAIDPGLTSGVFMTQDENPTKFLAYELDFDNLATHMDGYFSETKEIIYEKYTITGETLKKTRQYEALEVIGMLRYFALVEDIPLIDQTPGNAKRLATDDRLRDLGWYIPGKGHATDAARHMFLRYTKLEKILFALELPFFTELPCQV